MCLEVPFLGEETFDFLGRVRVTNLLTLGVAVRRIVLSRLVNMFPQALDLGLEVGNETILFRFFLP